LYNRYIPQSDGTYRRSRMQEHKHEPPRHSEQVGQTAPPVSVVPPQISEPCHQNTNHPSKRPQASNVSGFLRQLLPKDFDTGDLMVILLLLLMAGDCEEDQNTALLTLALYLFI